ncbi:hypothetical protein [Sphingomonas sp. OTU376]|uniref:hypothetical protein n=1 Tax=Sphingomonas sp. OTU376 TaxID=3043863 RepID=UPI00313F0806
MKLLPILAAAAAATLVIPAASAAAAAPAAPAVASQPDFQHHRPHHVRKRSYYRSVCKTVWRHGHRQRVCRRVRYYR